MKKIQFDYIKANNYKECSIDGAFGGITPSKKIQISLFSERSPIPKSITHELDEDGKLGKEIDRDTREAIIRNVEVTVYLNSAAAISLHNWLGKQIENAGITPIIKGKE
ncbi:MAG: hypothetical protein J7K01_02585 [Thermovirga sp.]|nr:hypothetical protein [Thermovirga sp.]